MGKMRERPVRLKRMGGAEMKNKVKDKKNKRGDRDSNGGKEHVTNASMQNKGFRPNRGNIKKDETENGSLIPKNVVEKVCIEVT